MNDAEIKEKITILLKSCLDNDKSTINKIYNELKECKDVHISLTENYGSSFKLNVSCQIFSMNFDLEFDDDYLPF